MASSDAFSEMPNFALEGDFPEDVELIPTQQLFFQMHWMFQWWIAAIM